MQLLKQRYFPFLINIKYINFTGSKKKSAKNNRNGFKPDEIYTNNTHTLKYTYKIRQKHSVTHTYTINHTRDTYN